MQSNPILAHVTDLTSNLLNAQNAKEARSIGVQLSRYLDTYLPEIQSNKELGDSVAAQIINFSKGLLKKGDFIHAAQWFRAVIEVSNNQKILAEGGRAIKEHLDKHLPEIVFEREQIAKVERELFALINALLAKGGSENVMHATQWLDAAIEINPLRAKENWIATHKDVDVQFSPTAELKQARAAVLQKILAPVEMRAAAPAVQAQPTPAVRPVVNKLEGQSGEIMRAIKGEVNILLTETDPEKRRNAGRALQSIIGANQQVIRKFDEFRKQTEAQLLILSQDLLVRPGKDNFGYAVAWLQAAMEISPDAAKNWSESIRDMRLSDAERRLRRAALESASPIAVKEEVVKPKPAVVAQQNTQQLQKELSELTKVMLTSTNGAKLSKTGKQLQSFLEKNAHVIKSDAKLAKAVEDQLVAISNNLLASVENKKSKELMSNKNFQYAVSWLKSAREVVAKDAFDVGLVQRWLDNANKGSLALGKVKLAALRTYADSSPGVSDVMKNAIQQKENDFEVIGKHVEVRKEINKSFLTRQSSKIKKFAAEDDIFALDYLARSYGDKDPKGIAMRLKVAVLLEGPTHNLGLTDKELINLHQSTQKALEICAKNTKHPANVLAKLGKELLAREGQNKGMASSLKSGISTDQILLNSMQGNKEAQALYNKSVSQVYKMKDERPTPTPKATNRK